MTIFQVFHTRDFYRIWWLELQELLVFWLNDLICPCRYILLNYIFMTFMYMPRWLREKAKDVQQSQYLPMRKAYGNGCDYLNIPIVPEEGGVMWASIYKALFRSGPMTIFQVFLTRGFYIIWWLGL
ncbi:hypothetical protein H8356DRAFT_1436443 [Neocallimastix lanati (nom. inval.)]|nr:hypothetical protein H8356DRAFT_1436443 [Neocallimastix sp. JGI-2020a]